MPKLDYMRENNNSRQVRSVMLTLTHDCNLRCRYCFEPNKRRDQYMDPEIAKRAIVDFMDAEDEFTAVQFDFFGGEPMLAFDTIREVVDWFHAQGPERWRKEHLFYIGTNGTVLTNEMKDWLVSVENCVHVGVSLDGNRAAHNYNRSNSYDQVMRNLPFFREHWPTQPCKMTIGAETIMYTADSVIELEEAEIPFTCNVVFEDIWGTPQHKAELLADYAQQLDQLVEYYTTHSDLVPALIVDRRLENMGRTDVGRTLGGDCVRWCGAGHEMIMVDIDGQRFPCHRFSPWVTNKAAPVNLVNRQNVWRPQECAECKFVGLCPTCAGFNWQDNGDPGIRSTYHCQAFKLEVLASARLQANRLLQMPSADLQALPLEEAMVVRRRLDAILELAGATQ